MNRRTVLTSGATAAMTAGAFNPLASLLDGGGDAGLAVPAWAAVSSAGPARADGLANIAADRAMTVDSPVRIASISKLVATLGFMTLVEAGKVGLDDDVGDILGFALRHPRFPAERITPRRLLSHTSGLRDGPSYPVGFGRPLSAALTPDGAQWDGGAWFGPESEPPGDWFAYCNTGFAVLAQVIEKVSGERFDRFMTDRLFRRLALDCGYNWSGVSQAARDRAGVLYRKAPSDEGPYDPAGPWIAQLDEAVPAAPAITHARAPEAADRPLDSYEVGTNGFLFSPQGGLRTSADDLARIAGLITRGGGPILGRRTLALMTTPVWRFDPKTPNGDGYGGMIRAYGLGCQTLTGVGGDNLFDGCEGWVGHAGDAYGLTSGLWMNLKTGRSMAYAITGEARSLKANRGRSNFTRQEELLAGVLAQV
ncbi:MAG: serine hydrolase domain-containing protein [Caulobacter sp.]|nr:serine hydrolase domain-containing protein [Caulobacter sp.]